MSFQSQEVKDLHAAYAELEEKTQALESQLREIMEGNFPVPNFALDRRRTKEEILESYRKLLNHNRAGWKEVSRLKSENETLKNALNLYADPEGNKDQLENDKSYYDPNPHLRRTILASGKRAREVLEK